MKTKIIVLIGLALCTMLLISPALASDAGTLEIYGNANEDDTIDMRDLTYVKLIFFGKKPEMELADAKYDGKINPLDFIQIKLIIVGKEKELTIVDSADRIVTVKKPVERVVVTWPYIPEAIRMLGEKDKIVGIGDSTKKSGVYFPEISKLPNVAKDYEAILSLNPDLVITSGYRKSTIKAAEKLPGITVVGFAFYKPETFIEELVKLGYIFGKKDEAKCYIDDFHDKYLYSIKARTEGLSEEERPKVYIETDWKDKYHAVAGGSAANRMVEITGGRNIFADVTAVWACDVDPEEVVVKNPDIIIKYGGDNTGYDVDDPSKVKALRDEIMSRPELAEVTAVKNGHLYIIDSGLQYGLDYPVALTYWAKWFHPELFEDLDPQAIHQEYLTEFQGLDYDLDERGVFVYPPLSG